MNVSFSEYEKQIELMPLPQFLRLLDASIRIGNFLGGGGLEVENKALKKKQLAEMFKKKGLILTKDKLKYASR